MPSRWSSSTVTNPGGPPLGDTSHRPWASAVATVTNGEWAMYARQLWSRWSICLATAGFEGGRYTSRNPSTVVMAVSFPVSAPIRPG